MRFRQLPQHLRGVRYFLRHCGSTTSLSDLQPSNAQYPSENSPVMAPRSAFPSEVHPRNAALSIFQRLPGITTSRSCAQFSNADGHMLSSPSLNVIFLRAEQPLNAHSIIHFTFAPNATSSITAFSQKADCPIFRTPSGILNLPQFLKAEAGTFVFLPISTVSIALQSTNDSLGSTANRRP